MLPKVIFVDCKSVVGPEFSNTETFLIQTQSFLLNNRPKTSKHKDLSNYTLLMGWQKEHNKGIHPDQPTRSIRQGKPMESRAVLNICKYSSATKSRRKRFI